MINELEELCIRYMKNITNLNSVQCSLLDTVKSQITFNTDNGVNFCEHCNNQSCNKINLHMYGSNEAYRWNGKYIYYCPKGFIYIAASLSDDKGNLIGSITAGPIIMESDDDFSECLDELNPIMMEYCKTLPHLTTSKVNSMSELLSLESNAICGIPHSKVGVFVYEQKMLLNSVYSLTDIYHTSEVKHNYPILYEKQLQKMIVSGDKKGSQKLFNDLLAHIFLASEFHLEIIKVRVIELIVLLSRATIDAGANINEIFCFNDNYIKRIEQFNDIEDLSVWLTGILHRFINYSFDFTNVKHSDVVYKVIQYIKSNYTKKLSLDEIANSVYLSSSYLSTIFKEETGQSLTNYINIIRIEKSKILMLNNNLSLVEISNMCGFDDQSYFTKVFKKITGISPKVYRSSREKSFLKQ